jgi:hypothetical protein
MNTAYLVEYLVEMGVNLEVTDRGKLRVVSNQDFITTPEFEQLKKSKAEIVSHLSQQKAESFVSSIKLRDDRIFIHQCLIGIYGTKRLDIVNKYLEQWRLGVEAEPVAIKQENAGRYRANAWIREEKFN